MNYLKVFSKRHLVSLTHIDSLLLPALPTGCSPLPSSAVLLNSHGGPLRLSQRWQEGLSSRELSSSLHLLAASIPKDLGCQTACRQGEASHRQIAGAGGRQSPQQQPYWVTAEEGDAQPLFPDQHSLSETRMHKTCWILAGSLPQTIPSLRSSCPLLLPSAPTSGRSSPPQGRTMPFLTHSPSSGPATKRWGAMCPWKQFCDPKPLTGQVDWGKGWYCWT